MSRIVIDDVVLRWIVTCLLGVSIAGYVYAIAAQHVRWTCTVNHLLHLAMSVAMIAMAWPVGAGLPTVGPMIFFLLAAFWFVLVAARASSGIPDRLTNGYNATMMATMVWMYAVMNGSPPSRTGHSSEHALSGSPDVEMAGMDMSEPQMSWTAAEPPGWISTVNWIATVGFAVAALCWLYRYFTARRTNPVPHTAQLAHLELLCQGFMAAGIAAMFGAML